MYALVIFLDILGAVILTAIALNLDIINVLPLAIFFCLFPLGFALMSEFIKVKALQTGTAGSDHRGIVRIIGIALILLILIFGVSPALLKFWDAPLCTETVMHPCRHSWTQAIIIVLAIEAVLLLVFPIFKEVKERRRVQYDKLNEENLI